MTYLHIINYRPTMYGLGRIPKNMSILGKFCWLAWEVKWPPLGDFESGDLVFLSVLGMVVLHIYTTNQPHISYGYENFPTDNTSKGVILAFKMAAWIWLTQFFVCRWAPWGYMLIPNLVTLAYTVMKTSCENWFRLGTTDDFRLQ